MIVQHALQGCEVCLGLGGQILSREQRESAVEQVKAFAHFWQVGVFCFDLVPEDNKQLEILDLDLRRAPGNLITLCHAQKADVVAHDKG